MRRPGGLTNMAGRRVVITGLGVVSSIGMGAGSFADALRHGRSGFRSIQTFDSTGFPVAIAGEVPDFDAARWLRRIDAAELGRASRFAAVAARMAVADAGADERLLADGCCGVSVGTTDGESQVIDLLMSEWVTKGPRQLSAAWVPKVSASHLGVAVARELDLHGEVTTISNACAAGNYAIGHAFDLISSGEADCMVCGGTDSVCRKNYAGFFKLGAITPTVVRPFDLNRQGILTGEGSGMLFLETLESAQQRGAHIYAEVLGYGLTSDANQMVVPDPSSIARCIRLAHAHAGITPDQVDYVCAHGTGTKVNDVAETAALRAAFGDRLPPTSSIKSMIGHTMGAASALGAIACALAITQEFLPPTINFETPDPECVIDCIPNQAREARPNVVENHGFAFGGHNAIVILGRESWNTARVR